VVAMASIDRVRGGGAVMAGAAAGGKSLIDRSGGFPASAF
jgi:hypothetical protein